MKSKILAWTAAALIGATLHSGTARADTPPPSPPPPSAKVGIALEFAELYGRTLGAASQCHEIPADRVEAVTKRAGLHLQALAAGDDARVTVGRRFTDAVSQGAAKVESGETICAQAVADFDNLDHELSGNAPAAPPAQAAPDSDAGTAAQKKE